MKVCSSCGFQNPDSCGVCEACGHPLEASDFSNGPGGYPGGYSSTPHGQGGYSSSYASGQSSSSKKNKSKGKKKKGTSSSSYPYGSSGSTYSSGSSYSSSSSYPSNPSYSSSHSTYHGGRPSSSKKSSKKKWIGIAGGCTLLVALAAAGGWWYMNRQDPAEEKPLSLRQAMASENSQTGAESENAQGSALESKVDAYTSAVSAGDLSKAEEIEKQAKEELSPEEFRQAKASFLQADADASVFSVDSRKHRYEVVAELGNLEDVPISLRDEVWAIKKDGAFSFIDTSGAQVSTSSTKMMELISSFTASQEPVVYACLADDEMGMVDPGENNQYPPNTPGQSYCRGGGAVGNGFYRLNEDGSVDLVESGGNIPAHEEEVNPDRLPVIVYKMDEASSANDQNEPYIYNPKTKTVDGPYDPSHPGSFNMYQSSAFRQAKDALFTGLLIAPPPGLIANPIAGSPYWVSRDGDIVLYAAKGDQELSGFDEATVIDTQTIDAKADGELQVYNASLAPLYAGCFELGGSPIQGVIPVKMNGSWVLIRQAD